MTQQDLRPRIFFGRGVLKCNKENLTQK